MVSQIGQRIKYEPRREKPVSGFPTMSDTSRAVQPQKMTKGMKYVIKKVEGLYYLWRENKDGDQLRGYWAADLRLCFRICKKQVSRSVVTVVRYK